MWYYVRYIFIARIAPFLPKFFQGASPLAPNQGLRPKTPTAPSATQGQGEKKFGYMKK